MFEAHLYFKSAHLIHFVNVSVAQNFDFYLYFFHICMFLYINFQLIIIDNAKSPITHIIYIVKSNVCGYDRLGIDP